MSDVTTRTAETTGAARARPRWARVVHNFGDDLRWACSGWCGFPRPVRRTFAAMVTAAGGWLVGADELIAGIVTVLSE